jgi:hypothetical protein
VFVDDQDLVNCCKPLTLNNLLPYFSEDADQEEVQAKVTLETSHKEKSSFEKRQEKVCYD